MLRCLREWKRKRVLQRRPLPDELWAAVTASMDLLQGLTEDELRRLRFWTTLFLDEKEFFGAQELHVSDEMKLRVGIQACLLILNLDLDCYAGWQSIIVYPDTFLVPREEIDETGIVHTGHDILVGESWEGGPVVISWADCAPAGNQYGNDINVVIHELAHKLDMQNGPPNGLPPLHESMDVNAWCAAFSAAFAVITARVENGEDTVLDPYAAEDPAELFAVASEYFFELPRLLQGEFPEVYRQLALYFRQDPASRRTP